ncbi:SDR family oxidoreductase [Afifella pfennigii]|uniref:SDR family oxidoreductase n=1 Tax=Afifella pfennigii TaxID=209897 RepID=UPI00047B155D|nr:SDR family oxidoreductase [Afifella pfennigii]
MDLGLHGKVAVVTAASRGLGYACAERLAREGCRLAICARSAGPLAEARAGLEGLGGEVLAVAADLACGPDIERFLADIAERFGRIDILIVNSGHIAYGGLEELDEAAWQEAFQLLLMSAVRLSRGALPLLRQAGGGDIVFLTSATIREPPPHLLLSTTMRLGVAGLAKTLSQAHAGENIRVNSVAPGYFDTGRVAARIDALMRQERLSRAEATASIAGDMPLKRIGTAEEFAELVAFVASRKAGFMTGSTLAIDGGRGRSIL